MYQRFIAVSAALTLPLAACSVAAQSYTASSAEADPVIEAFPELEQTDLALDDGYRLGVLDNGMRYIIRSNATPPERGLVRLWVDFGSVAEAEHEQGFAHFIEHMAFNGSTNIPEGQMVQILEREGLSFGADTNASTSFDATQYRLDLPRNDMELLDTALMLMREVASEVTFDEDAVEREKGIILSERRTRDTFGFQAGVDNIDFLWPGSRMAQRLPIGTIETIENATGDGLRSLYERYYRPQNVALVVVGDYDADAVEAAVAARFGDWQGPDRFATVSFGPIDPSRRGETDIYVDPALSETLAISRIGDWIDRPDTIAQRARRTLAQVGYRILNRRLARLARSDDPPFRRASFRTSDFFEDGRISSLTIASADGGWRRGLAAAQAEYRRAVQYGFTQAEVDEQLAGIRRSLENAASGADTRGNAAFVSGSLGLLRHGRIPTHPQDALERYEALEGNIKPESVLDAFTADAIALDDPLIRFSGRTAPDGGSDGLRDAWDTGRTLAIAPPEETAMAEFAYTYFGEPGSVVSDERDDQLGIRTLRFANGVMLNLKPTELQDDRVLVSVSLDGGAMLRTRESPLAVNLASRLLSGGLGEHTADELQSILAGRSVSVNFRSTPETFLLRGSTTPAELPLQLQLLTATVTDAGFRSTGEAQYRQHVENQYARLTATPAAALSSALGAILSDGDPRFSLPNQADAMELTFASLRETMADRMDQGAIEVALVGDFDEAEAIALVGQTLGAVGQRETDFREYADRRQRSFTADRSLRTLYHDGEADQALVTMIWPTRDDSDFAAALQLEMLERVVRLMLQEVLREELGQSYSPSASASQSSVYDGFGTFTLRAQVEVDDVEPVREAMLASLASLRDAGINDDILLRARQPMLESYDNALETNPSWMGLVARAQGNPEGIERYLHARDILTAITAADLEDVLARYLSPEDRLEILVLPRADDEGSSL